jgi:hypothetical protein
MRLDESRFLPDLFPVAHLRPHSPLGGVGGRVAVVAHGWSPEGLENTQREKRRRTATQLVTKKHSQAAG